MTKVIIDTDTGTDDAIALIAALNSPELDILGLTTVGGNARLAHTTRNALRLASYLGRSDLPIYKGADRALKGRFQFAEQYHGPGGMTTRLPVTDSKPQPIRAAQYIQEAARDHAGDLVLIPLGPLTNIARAIRREPGMKDWIREIVVMGGAVEVAGNVTDFAEFNIYDDPHAANIVFDSGIPVILVGLDVCNQVAFGKDDDDWRSGTSKGEELARRILEGWFDIHPDSDRFALYDPLTVAAAIDPTLLEYRQTTITVDEEGEAVGRTRAEYGSGNVKVAVGVDVERAHDFVLSRLATKD